MNKKIIYVDNAATTKISKTCFEAMLPFLTEHYGNPSNIYSIAHTAKNALEKARQTIAHCIGASPEEIFFTSGGSESDTWAITSTAQTQQQKHKKNKIITTNIEHHAVLNTCKHLEKNLGFEVIYLPVNSDGLIDAKQVEDAIDEKTALVTIMAANNEIGTLMPITEIAEICNKNHIAFHTDAVQAIGHIPINVTKQKISLMSISGHKFGAPKGIGVLFANKKIKLQNLIFGGGQENSKRPGTENVAFAVGMAQSLKESLNNIEQKNLKLKQMQNFLLENILNSIPKCRLNGSITKRLNSNLNFSFEGIEGESILLLLDSFGICASSGSACTSGSLDPSHVLLAIGLKHEIAHGSLRISLSENNTMHEMEYIVKILPQVVKNLRTMSPIWKD